MKPLVQIGFMPEALSIKPQPYRHDWQPGVPYNRIYTGWAHPPKDYDEVARARLSMGHALGEEVRPGRSRELDLGSLERARHRLLAGHARGIFKLYDYAADGLKRALPTARIGGPDVTGPNGERTQKFLRDFLEHCLRGTNYATGKIGTPLDFVTLPRQGRAARHQGERAAFVRMCGQQPASRHCQRVFASSPRSPS